MFSSIKEFVGEGNKISTSPFTPAFLSWFLKKYPTVTLSFFPSLELLLKVLVNQRDTKFPRVT